MANHQKSAGTNLSHFNTLHKILSRPRLSTPSKDAGNKPCFMTMHQNGQKGPKLAYFKTISSNNKDMTDSFKTPDNGSQKLANYFKTTGERVKRLNLKYMVTCDEVRQVISGPQMAVAE